METRAFPGRGWSLGPGASLGLLLRPWICWEPASPWRVRAGLVTSTPIAACVAGLGQCELFQVITCVTAALQLQTCSFVTQSGIQVNHPTSLRSFPLKTLNVTAVGTTS